MKNIKIYNMPKDKIQYEIDSKASNMFSALIDIVNTLRHEVKHIEPENRMNAEAIKQYINEVLLDEDINLDTLGN